VEKQEAATTSFCSEWESRIIDEKNRHCEKEQEKFDLEGLLGSLAALLDLRLKIIVPTARFMQFFTGFPYCTIQYHMYNLVG